ncbi:MAG TPA: hypothetical protein VGO57_17645 [Verrucomicrobiae bacterium]|jgi:hypothetical protein
MARLTISFNPAANTQFPVKMIMKNSLPIPRMTAPSIFQVAARLDEVIAVHPATVIPLNQKMPFTDLMLHPEKVEAVLRLLEPGNHTHGKKSSGSKMATGRSLKRNV